MPTNGILRRASYGPTSPTVGARGARTRQNIIDATLDLFEERGFHGTLVDDIANAVGISRAALYQYFESKEDIFIELLRECGAALLRVIQRLGPLGPTAAGYDNLHWWLGEWAWVYDKYSTMFVEWSHVDAPNAPLRPLIVGFLEEYKSRMTKRIVLSDVEDLEPEDLAVALLAIVNRINYYRATSNTRGLSDDELLDTLATVLQLVLFPSTPARALVHTAGAPFGQASVEPPPKALHSGRSAVNQRTRPETGQRRIDRIQGYSERVQVTVRQILDAAARVFAADGYHSSSVDDIVSAAGLGRGTFYKYLEDKLDLLIMLGEECADCLLEMGERLVEIGPGRAARRARRAWLYDFIEFHRKYAGVFRVWTEQEPDDPTLQAMGRVVTARVVDTLDEVLGGVSRTYPFNVRAASLLLVALLERLPNEVAGADDLPTDRLVDLMSAVMERGFLNARRTTGKAD